MNQFEYKTSKVTGASFKKEWKGNDGGPMYDHTIEFENGDKGNFASPDKEQKSFIIGNTAFYRVVVRGKFTDIVAKPQPRENKSNGGFIGKSNPKNYKADFISFAASYAKDLLVAGKFPEQKFEVVAEKIYKWMEDKYNNLNKENENTNPPAPEKK